MLLKTNHSQKQTHFPLKEDDYLPLINLAFKEDQVDNDITTKSIPLYKKIMTRIITKEKCVIAGIEVVHTIFDLLDPTLNVKHSCKDGQELNQNQEIMSITGNIQSILPAERTALNFLSMISGIATSTRIVTKQLSNYGITLLDTRKTVPGFRVLSKYAVSVGGGKNHRSHLGEQGLIKDNHISAYGDIKNTILIFKKKFPKLFCQIEVENKQELAEALLANPDGILLDNMAPRKIKQCANLIKKYSKKKQRKIIIEASGGYNLKNIRHLQKTGIDYISMSSITMNSKPINFSLEVISSS